MPRYAVYWLPDEAHPLWRAGCAWLGRDPASTAGGAPPPGRGDPWRYGFHATLKAPIALRPPYSAADFVHAVRALALAVEAFELPPLAVGELDGFVALRPTAQSAALQALADRCVVELDVFRAPMPPAEQQRRAAGLSALQLELLQRWGYPHVLSAWRMHLTLTDREDDARRRRAWRDEARRHFDVALRQPLAVRDIAVLEEPAAGAPLTLLCRLPLGGAARRLGGA
jgi:hypothetical protein